jgi:uncharacterized protein YjbI with pentapeptide repeats
MGARFRSWRQQIKQHPVRLAVIIGAAMLGIALLVVLVLGYIFNWGWTGLGFYIPPTKDSNFQRGKTLWDWLQLLIIPAVLVAAGYVINLTISRSEQEATKQRAQSEQEAAEKRAKTEHEIALDNQRETALQVYIDKMSELLLHENLRDSQPEAEARTIARVRTITILYQLDARRIGYVFSFLRESGLMSAKSNKSIVSFTQADLRKINFSGADFREADLREADLHGADLIEADLSGAILGGANLCGARLFLANLNGTQLQGADLSGARLEGVKLVRANLRKAYLIEADLSGARLQEADLRGAYLQRANFSGAYLGVDEFPLPPWVSYSSGANLEKATGIIIEELEKQAKSLKGATMPDGTKHD